MVGQWLPLLLYLQVHGVDFALAVSRKDQLVSVLLHYFVSFLATVGFVAALDPRDDFCRLHSHRTAVVDRKLYIDGGFVNWAPMAADLTNETSEYFQYAATNSSDLMVTR